MGWSDPPRVWAVFRFSCFGPSLWTPCASPLSPAWKGRALPGCSPRRVQRQSAAVSGSQRQSAAVSVATFAGRGPGLWNAASPGSRESLVLLPLKIVFDVQLQQCHYLPSTWWSLGCSCILPRSLKNLEHTPTWSWRGCVL